MLRKTQKNECLLSGQTTPRGCVNPPKKGKSLMFHQRNGSKKRKNVNHGLEGGGGRTLMVRPPKKKNCGPFLRLKDHPLKTLKDPGLLPTIRPPIISARSKLKWLIF